jgi:adenylyl-sulfate kinase
VTQGFTLWFTGLSGAGKTTLTNALVPQLLARGARVEVLDGDEVRTNLSKGLGFSKEDRDTNIRRIGYVSRLLARNGVGVIAAAISPYREIRDEVRGYIEADGAIFLEIFVKASLDTLVSRDVKGLYKKALAGEIKQFTGVSDPYEEPLRPELVVETDRETVEESAAKILAKLEELKLIAAAHQIGNAADDAAESAKAAL